MTLNSAHSPLTPCTLSHLTLESHTPQCPILVIRLQMPIIETRLSAPSFSPIEPNPPEVEALMRFPGSHTHIHIHTHTHTFVLMASLSHSEKSKQRITRHLAHNMVD
ncbi:hypothetical protein CH63R_00722 [Colletotrichum higginsianum IMI 349063]|uniref:Uncharacterized protein n=1 Tax=Colletotrichum higginsianum (strain IMI 349063) TaxID=759273 RepID=A0A1B7YUB3_COLHI|nr:hypothetical protein CH63R_00722 [Colletotrichum higginsianum IMI 349063]OBR15542.1 hypothetical protein CH63R_00722 [Colletotrichum higginsianum IMI 349063]